MNPTVSESRALRLDGQLQPAQGRVEGGEQPRVGEHVRTGERVEQCRFSGVRVSAEGHRGDRHGGPLRPMQTPCRPHLVQVRTKLGETPADLAAVAFPAGSHPDRACRCLLPAENIAVPSTRQAGQHVLELRKLDLQPPFTGTRVPREDVEDELASGPAPDGPARAQDSDAGTPVRSWSKRTKSHSASAAHP